MALVHVEVESDDSVAPLRPRIFEYYTQLGRDYSLPVLPVGLYLRVGLDGIGRDEYEEMFWNERVVHFRYGWQTRRPDRELSANCAIAIGRPVHSPPCAACELFLPRAVKKLLVDIVKADSFDNLTVLK